MNNNIKVELILDSIINEIRVSTFSLWFPRFLLPQFNTHRVFSRNASSMRAIPTKIVLSDYAIYIPDNFYKNQKGMQPSGKIEDKEILNKLYKYHNKYMKFSKKIASKMAELGVAKEQANRYIESICYVKVLMTTTELNNFITLRLHKDAQSEISLLAQKIKENYENSIPVVRKIHLPFVIDLEYNNMSFDDLLKTSVARCARVSYYSFQRENNLSSLEEDTSLFNKLIISNPRHFSPAEHQVFSPVYINKFNLLYKGDNFNETFKKEDNFNGNFKKGVIQYRKILEKIFCYYIE